MIKRLITNYVQQLQEQDVIKFSLEHNVKLSNEEVKIIYDIIKQDWEKIVFENHESVLRKIKGKIDSNTYKKIEELIVLYKHKYQHYL